MPLPNRATRGAFHARPSLLLVAAAAFALAVFLTAQTRADEPITVEGQFDSTLLRESLDKAGFKGATEASNTISLEFPREGGSVTGEFALEFEDFPIGAMLVAIGQAVGQGVAGSIAGALAGADITEGVVAPTPTAKERVLLTCTSTLSLTGTLTGTYDAAAGHFTGEARRVGSAYEDLKCSESIPGVTDTAHEATVEISAWDATFDGVNLVRGVIAPASEAETLLAFEAQALAPNSEPDEGTATTGSEGTTGGSAAGTSDGGRGAVGETGLASRVLRPGSRTPTIENTAVASALIATTASLISLSLIRQPRTPRLVEEGQKARATATEAAGYLVSPGEKLVQMMQGQNEAGRQRLSRSVLRRLGLSRPAVDAIGSDAPRICENILLRAPNINALAGDIRNELLNNQTLATQVLRDAGFTPIQIRLLGGPKRIVRNTERLFRNPPRAIGEFLGDTIMNLRRPDRLIKRAGRAVLNSNPLTGFIGRTFGLFGMR